MQVSLCAIYKKLTEAYQTSGSNLSVMKWLDAKSQDNDMCLYWRMILDLEIGICIFLRSIRESNFHLYVLAIKNLRKWLFAMDHYNYSCWISVHLFDLVHLHLNSPDVYGAFMSGQF